MEGNNFMIIKGQYKKLSILFGFCLVLLFLVSSVRAQVEGPQAQKIKWIVVGSLQQWFSSGGAEIEYGRRGRAGFESVDQQDGLRYPALFNYQDVNVGKSLWIGTTNFTDPVSGVTYDEKVVCAGRLFMYLGTEIFGDKLVLYGKFPHPNIYVDVVPSSRIDYDDEVDVVDPDLPCDRMIYNDTQ